MSVNEKMTAIADAIRDKTNGTTRLTLDDMATEIPNVYESGKEIAYNEFWDSLQNYGNRTDYESAFRRWEGVEHITPKYPIKTSTASSMFLYCRKLVEAPTIELTTDTAVYYSCFGVCQALKEVRMDIKPSTVATALQGTFNSCIVLETIDKIIVTEGVTYNNTFNYCYKLKNLVFEGVIGNNMNLSACTNLSKGSILNIFDCLATKSGCTLTLGTTNLAKLTEAEKSIATNKGWALA